MGGSTVVAMLALVVSAASLVVAVSAKRQAGKVGLLAARREAISHVREARKRLRAKLGCGLIKPEPQSHGGDFSESQIG